MEPVYLSIRQQETGSRIRELLDVNGYTVKDIQGAMGFENPQAVYKWISGKSIPSIDNLLILSKILHTSIEDILVVDGDIVILGTILKMLVTQALDERDLLVKKISDKIAKASFVDTIKPNEEKVYEKRISKEEFSMEAESAYQQIVDPLDVKKKLESLEEKLASIADLHGTLLTAFGILSFPTCRHWDSGEDNLSPHIHPIKASGSLKRDFYAGFIPKN